VASAAWPRDAGSHCIAQATGDGSNRRCGRARSAPPAACIEVRALAKATRDGTSRNEGRVNSAANDISA
jgi:hypothetical protein